MKRLRDRLMMALAVVALTGAPRSAAAQAPLVLDSGRLVRVQIDSTKFMTGHLLQPFSLQNPSMLLCRSPGTPCTAIDSTNRRIVPIEQLRAIEVAHGSAWLPGAIVGAGLGALLGHAGWEFGERQGDLAVAMIGGAVVVGALGAMIGGGFDVWRTLWASP